MTNLEALVIPDCAPREGPEGWYFPCGLWVVEQYGKRPTDEYQPLEGSVGRIMAFGTSNFLTEAHLRHHRDQHDELDNFIMVELRMPPDHTLIGVTCQCSQDDMQWNFVPQFKRLILRGGML